MKQTSLFDMTVEGLYDSVLLPALKLVIRENWLDENSLVMNKRKQYYSISFDDQIIARVAGGKRPYISFPDAAFSYRELLEKSQRGEKPDSNGYYKYKVNSLEEISNYAGMLSQALEHIIESTPKDFSCCSRYEECSRLMQCINPSHELRIGCYYRKVMRRGEVFFGKNDYEDNVSDLGTE